MKIKTLSLIPLVLMLKTLLPTSQLLGQSKSRHQQQTPSSHSFQFANTSLIDALTLIEDLSRRPILLDEAAIKQAGVDLSTPISIKIKKRNYDDVIDQILPADLIRINRGRSLLITTNRSKQSGSTGRRSFTSARQLAMQTTLKRVVPIHFDQMPLSIALEFIGGFAGMEIDLPPSDQRKAEPLVTLHENRESLMTCLEKILAQSGMTYEIRNKKIVVWKLGVRRRISV